MYINNSDVLSEFENISKTFELTCNVKAELCEAHDIYLELIEVRKKLAEAENNFPVLN